MHYIYRIETLIDRWREMTHIELQQYDSFHLCIAYWTPSDPFSHYVQLVPSSSVHQHSSLATRLE